MSGVCHRLHQFVNTLEIHTVPFADDYIPMNGIYLFFENGQYAHGARRIVRVGTHTGANNLRGRLREHFVNAHSFHDDFRTNIAEALSNKHNDSAGHAPHAEAQQHAQIEDDVRGYLQKNFSFVAIPAKNKERRLELESRIIGTIARCKDCGPWEAWLGCYSPKERIRKSGLWQVQQIWESALTDEEINEMISSYSRPEIPKFDDQLLNLVAQHLHASDGRNRSPDAYTGKKLNGRRNTYLRSFYKAYGGSTMRRKKLARYTWSNLGWRLGAVLRAVTDEELSKDEQQRYADLLFYMLVHLFQQNLSGKVR